MVRHTYQLEGWMSRLVRTWKKGVPVIGTHNLEGSEVRPVRTDQTQAKSQPERGTYFLESGEFGTS